MVTMKDVAKQAGVSVATVSNVITGKNYVSPPVKKKVERAIRDLGYRVNLLARGLKVRHTHTIGVVLPDISKVFFPYVLKGIQEAAQDAGYRVNFLSSDYSVDMERECVEYLRANCVDGIIIDSCFPSGELEAWAADLATGDSTRRNFPVVSMEQVMDAQKVSSVLVDYVSFSKQEALHLIDSGRRDILYLKVSKDLAHACQRFRGYCDALAERNISFRPEYVRNAEFSAEEAYVQVKDAIKSGLHFDAVHAMNDSMALGAMKALTEEGLRVPEQVAVAGWDNISVSTIVIPQITTVESPKYELGNTAFAELKRLMDDPQAKPRSVMLNAELMIRGSSAAVHDGDWSLSL